MAVTKLRGPIIIGDGTNSSTFEDDGTLKFSGNATTWDDIRVGGLLFTKGAAGSPDLASGFAGSASLLTYQFDGGGADEYLLSQIQFPHSYKLESTIYPHVHWAPIDANAGNVKWYLHYTWQDVNGVFSKSSSLSITDAAAGTAWTHQYIKFPSIDGTGMDGVSSMFLFRLGRDSGDGQDTYGSDAALLEFDIHFEMDTLGSREETSK